MKKQKIILEQIDNKISIIKKCNKLTIPSSGWVNGIRLALGMSLRQLGNRMNITPQSVKEIEEREINGSISLKVLKQFGYSLNMKLVYGFIPENQSLSDIINKRAIEVATKIVERTSLNMKLENQENSQKRISSAIKEKAEEIKNEMPKNLWD